MGAKVLYLINDPRALLCERLVRACSSIVSHRADLRIRKCDRLRRYVLSDAIHEITVDKDGRIDGQGKASLKIENIRTELARTEARDQGTGTQRS